jgi:hypothetical protein
MKNWQIAVSITALTLAVGATYLYTVWRHRLQPAVTDASDNLSRVEHLDSVAAVRLLYPTGFNDLKPLEGKPVWIKNGYTMSYYPCAGNQVNFSKKAGLLPPAARLEIQKFLRVSVPAGAHDGIEPAGPQAFAVFHFAGDKATYATPVGAMTRGAEAYYADILFFYDDPHSIYDHWPPEVWQAVDAHRPREGMTELEARMALGSKIQSDSRDEGNRTVIYDQAGKLWTIVFRNNRATRIQTR